MNIRHTCGRRTKYRGSIAISTRRKLCELPKNAAPMRFIRDTDSFQRAPLLRLPANRPASFLSAPNRTPYGQWAISSNPRESCKKPEFRPSPAGMEVRRQPNIRYLLKPSGEVAEKECGLLRPRRTWLMRWLPLHAR